MQLAHARHRHEDAEPAVVLAAVPHRVVVAAGEEARRVGLLSAVQTDDVADCVDCDLVEAAVVAHPARELRGARAVRVGEIGHRQLAGLGVAGVAVRCERLGPVPHQVAERRDDAEALVEPDLGDPVDVAQALGALEVGVVLEAAREGRDDLVACAGPGRAPRARRG